MLVLETSRGPTLEDINVPSANTADRLARADRSHHFGISHRLGEIGNTFRGEFIQRIRVEQH